MSRKKLPDNTELSSIMQMLIKIQDFREEAWIERYKNKTLPEHLLKLRDITKRCTQHVQIYDGQVYPKEIDKDLYTFGDAYDSVLSNANLFVQKKYAEKSHSDETRDCICDIISADRFPTEESNRKYIESAPQTEPICSKYASQGRDLSIISVSGSTVEHSIAGPSSSADLSNFSNTTGGNSLNPSDSVDKKFEKDRVPTGANKQEDSYNPDYSLHLLQCLNASSRRPVIESYYETDESDYVVPSDDSSDLESVDEDESDYEKKVSRYKMKDIVKYGYQRIKKDMGKTYYRLIRPERRNNDFGVYPKENTMLPKEKPRSDSQNLRQPKRKISAKSLSKFLNKKNLVRNMPDKSLAKSSTSSGKQKGQFGNKRKKSISSTESPVKKVRKISRKVSHVAKHKITKPTKVAQLKQSRSQLFTKSKSLMKEGNLFLSESTSTSDQQKIPPKSTRVSAGSGKKVKQQSSKKSLLVAKKRASSKNTGSQFKKISEKTRQNQNISLRQSAKTSAMKLCLRSRINVSSKLQNKRKYAKDSSILKAEGMVKNISSQSSESRLNVPSELQNKIKQSKKKPAKDSSVQKAEAKMKNISLGSSKSEHIKKRKAESDDSCSILSRNTSCSAKQKIMKPTKVAELKPPRSQLFTKSKSLMKDGNLFSLESASTSDLQKISPKSTRVSMRFGKKS